MLLQGAKNSCLNKAFPIILVFIVILFPYITSSWDPYEVLGVKRDTDSDQIKRAYRVLARRYHPDKSTNENDSGKKFIEINKAFDILKDPVRKARYDKHGTIEEGRQSRGYHHGNMYQHQRQARENWSAFTGTFSFYSSSGGAVDSYFRRKSINTRQYLNDYVKESTRRPFLIFFYTDFCPSCFKIEPIWIKITNELAKYNVGSAAINVHMEPRLSRELDVSSIPHIACLLDGHLHHYYQHEISLASFVKFIKSLLPNDLVPFLMTAEVQDRHISRTTNQSNKLSAIIITDGKNLKLRYLLLAYSLRQYYRFGHVSTKLSEYTTLAKQYNLLINSKSHILVFDERINAPKVHIQSESESFPTEQNIRDLLAWPFLRLPRLSSQQVFDDLCLFSIPKEGDKVTPKLCVILFAPSTPSSLPGRKKMLEFIELNNLSQNKKVVFAYIDPMKQSEFVNNLRLEGALNQKNEIESNIILIQRQADSSKKARYRWIQSQWDANRPDELDRAKLELYRHIEAYRKGAFELKEKLLLAPLEDEDGPSLAERMYSRFLGGTVRALYHITTRESFSTVIILLGCVLLTSLFLYKSPVPTQYTSPESDFQYYRAPMPTEPSQMKSQARNSSHLSPPETEMKIMELRAETYNGMVRLLKPGFRSIVLLADRESKDKLLENFKKSVWPYRKNRTLLFGFLCLDKNLNWYRKLLEQVLGCEDLQMNKKNCIGTVLSLNGFKKYFRVYHAKHHEIDYYDNETENDGSFLGFNEENDHIAMDPEIGSSMGDLNESRNTVVYTVDNLLDKLPIWLDKMFDGLTKRYFVDYWPDEIR